MKRILLLAFLLTIFFAAIGQRQTVTGRVTDVEGNALAGANVVVSNTMLGVISGEDGSFQLNLDERKIYEIRISYMGYETLLIDMSRPFNPLYELVLRPSSFIADEVVVRATRAGNKTPMAYKNMEKREITSQNMGQDMGYLLSLTPSLVQSSESGT